MNKSFLALFVLLSLNIGAYTPTQCAERKLTKKELRAFNLFLNSLRTNKLEDSSAYLEIYPDFVHFVDAQGYTPLHYARCPEAIHKLLVGRLVEEQKKLLEKKDIWGRTPLHMAHKKEKVTEVVKALIVHGADSNALDNSLNTPLHFIGDYAAVKLLLEAGANPNLRNGKGLTPWGVWTLEPNWKKYRDVFILLLSYFASVRSDIEFQRDVLAFLFGRNSLHYACAMLKCKPIEKLLEQSKYKQALNKTLHEITPLHLATSQNHLKLVVLLVQHGAQVTDDFIQKVEEHGKKLIAKCLKSNLTRLSQQNADSALADNQKETEQETITETESPRDTQQTITDQLESLTIHNCDSPREFTTRESEQEVTFEDSSSCALCLQQPQAFSAQPAPQPPQVCYYPVPVPVYLAAPPGFLFPYGHPFYHPMQPPRVSSPHLNPPVSLLQSPPFRTQSPIIGFSFFLESPQNYIGRPGNN